MKAIAGNVGEGFRLDRVSEASPSALTLFYRGDRHKPNRGFTSALDPFSLKFVL